MNDFIAHNWGWITFAIIATPIVSYIGYIAFRAWIISFGAWAKGIHLSITNVMLMQTRRVDVTTLLNQLITAKQNNLIIDTDQLVAHMMAGGNIRRVIAGLISAKRFAIPLTLERACAVDLVGQDPLQLISDTVRDAERIPAPSDKNGLDGGKAYKPPVSPAAVLLQAKPGTPGTIIAPPQLTARVSFPQGELDVMVNAKKVPKVGDSVLIASVDGITIFVDPK